MTNGRYGPRVGETTRSGTDLDGAIAIVSASVGAGHDGAAGELARRLRLAGWTVDCHDFLDLLPGSLGRALRSAYAAEMTHVPASWEWVLRTTEQRHAVAAAVTNLTGRLGARRASRALTPAPAAVVTTYPLAAQVLGWLRRRGTMPVPTITYLTDLSVHRLWVAPGVDAHIALHSVAAAQAERLGAASIRLAAPAVRPEFRPAISAGERARAREAFGLPGGTRLALVTAGSWGVGEVAATAREIARSGAAVPVVACGRNAGLRERLAAERVGVAVGWVDNMPELLHACDVVVQNAGGLTSLEALAAGLPVLTYRPLPGHGTSNAAALDAAGLAPWIKDPHALSAALSGATAVPLPEAAEATRVILALAGEFGDAASGRAA